MTTSIVKHVKLYTDAKTSHTIRSVAAGTQWSGPINSRIVYELLLSHTTECDRGSGRKETDVQGLTDRHLSSTPVVTVSRVHMSAVTD